MALGRPKGRQDSKPRDPTANRENARKPRTSELKRELRQLAQDILGPAIAQEGLRRIARVIRGEEGTFEEFKWAIEFGSGRIGLPAVMRQEHEDVTPGREVVAVDRPIPWLEASTDASANGDHDGRSERVSVQ